MNVVGMNAQEQQSVLQMVSGILHIGNLTFREDKKGNASIVDQGSFSSYLNGPDQFRCLANRFWVATS